MNELDPAIPCGIVAKSFFNDTYELWRQTGVEKDLSLNSKDVNIPINQGNIAWSSDVTYKFSNLKKNIPAGKDFMDLQWHDLSDCKFLFYSFNLFYRTLYCLDENCWPRTLPQALGKRTEITRGKVLPSNQK